MSWNGIPDPISNTSYVVISIYAISLYIRYGQIYRLAYVFPILISILTATSVSVFAGTNRFPDLRQLETKYLSVWFNLVNSSSNYNPSFDLIAGTKWIVAILSYPYIIQVYKRINSALLDSLKFAWLAGLVINIIFQIFQSFSLTSFHVNNFIQAGPLEMRASGLATHPNALAISVCLSIPIVSECLQKYGVSFRFLLYGLFAFSILLTQSRAGFLLYGFGLFITVFLRLLSFSRKILSIIAFSVLLIWGYLSGTVIQYISYTRLDSENVSAIVSNQIRLSLLKYGLEVFKEFPIFGGGPSLIKVSHNIYLQVLSSIGLIGLIAFLNLFVQIVLKNWKKHYESNVIVIIFLLFGMFNNSIVDFYLYFPLGTAFILNHYQNGIRKELS